jgi:hypothetical protein
VDVLEKYIKDIEAELKIDEFNIKDAALKSPGRKHYWVGRLIHHKRNVLKLESERSELIKSISKELHHQSPVKLSSMTVERTASDSDLIKSLQIRINDEKMIIEFLEKIEKIFSSLSFDIKNIVEIMKLEQL